jgi:hypothetical protein
MQYFVENVRPTQSKFLPYYFRGYRLHVSAHEPSSAQLQSLNEVHNGMCAYYVLDQVIVTGVKMAHIEPKHVACNL